MSVQRVLIVSQVIPQWYVDLLAEALGEDVQIDIITGSEVKGNVIKSPEHDASSFKSRLISWYRHYKFIKRWRRDNKTTKYDLVFAVSNPPINPYIGLKLKKSLQVPFIYMNWDLYPQVIRASIHNPVVGMICNIWSVWNNKHYPQIDQIITIGDVMASSMNEDLKKGVPVRVIPIGVDTIRLKPIPKADNRFCLENELVDKFVVLYSGKMGLGHNIELILEASEQIADYKDIVFVFIGFGPKADIVKQYIRDKKPENVRLFPLQSEEMFPYSMACGDIGIVTQEASMAHLFMPSKVYSMMACGEAIVGIGTDNDDLSKLIKEEEIGVSIVDGSANTLAAEILALYNNRKLLRNYRETSRKVAERKFDIRIVQNSYADLFRSFL